METPCEWAAKAINDKGQEFTLSMDGKSVTERLTTAEKMNIGGGYVGYQFRWNGPISGDSPAGDGIYTINGAGAGEAQLFVIYSSAGGQGYWACTVTCQS